MPTPIDPKRLPRLRAAKARFKPGDMLPQQELAKIYGVSNARLTTLIHQRFESFPPFERRGDKTHWYAVLPALEAMIAYALGQSKRKAAAAARVAHIFAGAPVVERTSAPAEAPPAEEPPLPTPADLDRLAKAEMSVFRLQQEKGKFVPDYQVRHVIQGIVAIVQRAFSGLAPEVDPHGELPPLVRAKLERSIKKSQLRLHDEVAQYLDADAA